MEVLRTREELAIDALLAASRACVRGYRQAAELADDPELEQLFTELGDARDRLIEGTTAACRDHQVPVPGDKPDERAARAVARRVAHAVRGDPGDLHAQRSLEQDCARVAADEARRDDNPAWVRSLATRFQSDAERALERLAGVAT